MNKASTTSAKSPMEHRPRSARARGTPRSKSPPQLQSAAPSRTPLIASHSRRPSRLGKSISVKDGFTIPRNSVAPLEMSANRWVPTRAVCKTQPDVDLPEMVDRKVRALLNTLTMKRFDSISDQIIQWANESVNEKDGRTLMQVTQLVFEKAMDEAVWSEMYARLCRKMMEQISPDVQDDRTKNQEGKPVVGGQLFRKHLLNRCQEDFEHGWIAKEVAATAKASGEQATKAANERRGTKQAGLSVGEFYAAQKAKRQGLGLIKFIGELFKLRMLTERIMHECVKKLLSNVENPEEEEIESLCQLLKTVGELLDTPKARAHMDTYFGRMKELGKSINLSYRLRFMLQDVIELRERKWVSRNAIAAPTMIAVVHEVAANDRLAAEKESCNRQASMFRGGDCNQEVGPDGWAVSGSSAPRRPLNPKTGDLSQFGKINKGAPMVMGPSSVFTGSRKDIKRESPSQTNSSSHMSNILNQNPGLMFESSVKHGCPTSQKPRIDLGQAIVPEVPIRRKKVQFLPQSGSTSEGSTPNLSEDEHKNTPTDMSEADAKRKIDEDVKEFFAIRNLEEADAYFTNLPHEHRFRLVDKLVASALESKEADARLVGEFFARAASNGKCTVQIFEEGFTPIAELLDDIAIDAPKAFDYMAIMLKGARFDKELERLRRMVWKLQAEDKNRLVSLVA